MAAPREITTNKHGFHVKWVLNEKTLLSRNSCKTEVKTVEGMPDVKWYLQSVHNVKGFYLYFNIESENEIEYTTYLHFFLNPDHARCESGISIGKKSIEIDRPYDSSFGKYIINGIVKINFHGFFRYTRQEQINFNIQSVCSAEEWGLRFKQNLPTDFTIMVEGQTIQIHKLIVSAESTVFKRMFEGSFKEARENQVTIPDCKYEIVQAAVDYCYAQNISAILEDQSKCIDLLCFANQYDFLTLKPKLENHLGQKICKENLSLLVSTADKTSSIQLRQSCIYFFSALINRNETFPPEELAEFDFQFLQDMCTQALNH
uniref:BTB domain-containing protein n=1 Tax=Panagrolaimus davidi TaxID=227884 RepID=A0A914QQV1_9BILA